MVASSSPDMSLDFGWLGRIGRSLSEVTLRPTAPTADQFQVERMNWKLKQATALRYHCDSSPAAALPSGRLPRRLQLHPPAQDTE